MSDERLREAERRWLEAKDPDALCEVIEQESRDGDREVAVTRFWSLARVAPSAALAVGRGLGLVSLGAGDPAPRSSCMCCQADDDCTVCSLGHTTCFWCFALGKQQCCGCGASIVVPSAWYERSYRPPPEPSAPKCPHRA
jgi:hypothetical protein